MHVVHRESHVKAGHSRDNLQRRDHLPQFLHGDTEEEATEDATVEHRLNKLARVRAYSTKLLVCESITQPKVTFWS